MICYHHNDLDGRCAGAIVLKKYPECRMREIDYKDNPIFHEEVRRNEKVFIVDFSFKPAEMNRLLRRVNSQDVIWIDHHKTAKEYHNDYMFSVAGVQNFSEPGLSGCELTWKYLYPEERMPDAVKLLGDYDTWQFKYGGSMAFQFGMRSHDTKPEDSIWEKVLNPNSTTFGASICEQGKAILAYKDNVSKNILKNHYKIVWEGWSCIVVNTPMIDSDMFKEYPNHLCVSWIYTGKQYIVSLRSRSSGACDVSKIAKKYGGGGHKGAAGFEIDKLPF